MNIKDRGQVASNSKKLKAFQAFTSNRISLSCSDSTQTLLVLGTQVTMIFWTCLDYHYSSLYHIQETKAIGAV
jgi:hypothetical protein